MNHPLEEQTIQDLPLPQATSEWHTFGVYGLEQVRFFLVLVSRRSRDLLGCHWRASLCAMHNCCVLISLEIQCLKGGGQLSEANCVGDWSYSLIF